MDRTVTRPRWWLATGLAIGLVAAALFIGRRHPSSSAGDRTPDPKLLERSPADTTPPTGYRIAQYEYFRYHPSHAEPRPGEWVARVTIVTPDGSRCLAYIAYGPVDTATGTNHGVYVKQADLARPSCAGAVAGFSVATHQVLGVDPTHLKEVEGF